MAKYLVRSINTSSSHDSVVFLPEQEIDAISPRIQSELEDSATVSIVGNLTIPEYGQSAKLDAFAAAAEQVDPPYVLVDTDTLLLKGVPEIFNGHEVVAKPVDIGAQYWGTEDSLEDWQSLYSRYGFEFPEGRVRSTVDGHQILPYYNAGVVGTMNPEFPKRWLELTKSVYNDIEETFYSDQISLAMLMSEYNTGQLSETMNYPGTLRFRFPSNIRVLHYHEWDVLDRIQNRRHRQFLTKIGIREFLSGLPTSKSSAIGASLKRIAQYRLKRQLLGQLGRIR